MVYNCAIPVVRSLLPCASLTKAASEVWQFCGGTNEQLQTMIRCAQLLVSHYLIKVGTESRVTAQNF